MLDRARLVDVCPTTLLAADYALAMLSLAVLVSARQAKSAPYLPNDDHDHISLAAAAFATFSSEKKSPRSKTCRTCAALTISPLTFFSSFYSSPLLLQPFSTPCESDASLVPCARVPCLLFVSLSITLQVGLPRLTLVQHLKFDEFSSSTPPLSLCHIQHGLRIESRP
jgi:hypothetical protein